MSALQDTSGRPQGADARTDRRIADREYKPKNGYSVVLWYAPPDVELHKIAVWHDRLRREGVIDE